MVILEKRRLRRHHVALYSRLKGITQVVTEVNRWAWHDPGLQHWASHPLPSSSHSSEPQELKLLADVCHQSRVGSDLG